MTPIEIILYACAFLLASIPVAIGVLIIGYAATLVKREWHKTPGQVQAEKLLKSKK